jgi:hypothetical protein
VEKRKAASQIAYASRFGTKLRKIAILLSNLLSNLTSSSISDKTDFREIKRHGAKELAINRGPASRGLFNSIRAGKNINVTTRAVAGIVAINGMSGIITSEMLYCLGFNITISIP